MKRLTFYILTLLLASASAFAADADQRLYTGIAENNLAAVELAIAGGAYLNKTYDNDLTPLMNALTVPHTDIRLIRRLISSGADARYIAPDGNTPLLLALQTNASPVTLQLLLNAGANPNLANKEGYTPLLAALTRSQTPETIKILLNAGADANRPARLGGNPLYPLTAAVALNAPRETILLLLKNSNQDAGFQALTAAIADGNEEMQKLLLEHHKKQKKQSAL